MTTARTDCKNQVLAACIVWSLGAVLGLVCGTPQITAQQARSSAIMLRLWNGQELRGQLVGINDKEVLVQVGKDKVNKPWTEVLQLAFPANSSSAGVAAGAAQGQIRLTDGTTLLAQKMQWRPKHLECQLFSGQTVSLPLDQLHWVLPNSQDAKARHELEQTLAQKPAQDVVLVLSRDQQAINPFAGVVLGGDDKGTRLNFRLEEDVVPLDLSRLRGVVFARRAEPKSREAVRVTDRFGNTWLAERVAWKDDRLQLITLSGLTTELSFDQITLVDFSQGRLLYLSDAEPLRVEEKPILADIWHYRRDRNLAGGPISLGQRIYSKGLTVHSRSVLEYAVEGYREFRCVVGIEDSVAGPAKALVRIEGDGRELFQATISTGDKPRELVLPIEGVARLRLIVDYSDDLDLGDHVVFAEARVLK